MALVENSNGNWPKAGHWLISISDVGTKTNTKRPKVVNKNYGWIPNTAPLGKTA